jgi:hypothetical protein
LGNIFKLEDVLIEFEEIQYLPLADKIILSIAIYNEMDFLFQEIQKILKICMVIRYIKQEY